MKNRLIICLLFLISVCYSQTNCTSFNPANFVFNGNAVVTNSPEVTLTIDQGNLFGTMWSNQEILFNEDFLIESELFFGLNDWGADGIAFVLQPQSSNAGGLGGGIGYAGISPSIAIEFDTYYNSGSDPLTNDHVAIVKDGQPFLLGPHSEFITPIDIGNVENGQWHTATFQWTASTQKLKLIFDGVQLFDVTIDLGAIFPSNNSVFWGFTSATGGANNLHKVKINNYCVTLDSNIPEITINSNLTYCISSSCEFIAPGISITEPNTIISGAKVYFTSNYVTGEDTLNFTPNLGITGIFDPVTGVLSLTGNSTIANYEQILESVCYQNNAINPTPGNRIVTYVIGDLLYNTNNQHFYKLVTTGAPVLWTEASTNAQLSNYFGLPGYLVTITDQQENDFINYLINSNSWLGATDTNIEGEWRWVTGCEGAENGGLGRLFSLQQLNAIGISVNNNYINWACVEPNNCCGGENYLHMIGPNTILCGNFGEWNDYPNSGIPYTGAPPVTNYIIEYGCSNNSVYSNLSASVVITVESETIPDFTQIADICSGATLSAIPTTSNNGISGTWSPAINNMATTTYAFTPNSGQCASSQTMTITVDPLITPTFSSIANICSGATLSALPTTSNNGITGTWSPALNNLATTTYTFTPNSGQCATNQTMNITVDPLITPTFNQIASICSGTILGDLPTNSTNGITGTWSPELNNNITTTYTFTPDSNQCASNFEMIIEVFDINTYPIPKGISPNGDGKNENWDLISLDVITLKLYNRYGQLVYEKENYTNEWFGQNKTSQSLPDGTYFYVLDLKCGTKTGWVYIIK